MAGQYTVHLKYLLQKIAQNNSQKIKIEAASPKQFLQRQAAINTIIN